MRYFFGNITILEPCIIMAHWETTLVKYYRHWDLNPISYNGKDFQIDFSFEIHILNLENLHI